MALTTAVNTVNFEGSPEISEDGLRLYYTSKVGTAPSIIQLATRAAVTGPFGGPATVPGLVSATQLSDATLSPDERVGVWTDLRTIGTDIYYASRASPADPFGPVMELASVNTPGKNDDDPTLSADGCELIFSSDRVGASQLYSARVVIP